MPTFTAAIMVAIRRTTKPNRSIHILKAATVLQQLLSRGIMAMVRAAAMEHTQLSQIRRPATAMRHITAANTIRANTRATSKLTANLCTIYVGRLLMITMFIDSSTGYATQPDTRYQSYSQDYSQQYGSTAVDYNATGQADYSQQSASYDERAYAGYGK